MTAKEIVHQPHWKTTDVAAEVERDGYMVRTWQEPNPRDANANRLDFLRHHLLAEPANPFAAAIVEEIIADMDAWKPIESAPVACHMLVTYFDHDFGEWVVEVEMLPFGSTPWTHWRPLPTPPHNPT